MASGRCLEMVSRVPLIVVLGATGTGKSKLAIELAKKFGGEIISADSMQVYKGLDVITNKVTTEEMDGVPHHLLNFVDPLDRYTVVDFRNKALPIIDRLMSVGKMPVVVGGTNYYIESILWKILIEEPSPGEGLLSEREAEDEKRLLGGVVSPKERLKIAATHLLRLVAYSESVFLRLLASLPSDKEADDIIVTDLHGDSTPDFTKILNERCGGKMVWCLSEMKSAEKEILDSLSRVRKQLDFKLPDRPRLQSICLESLEPGALAKLRDMVSKETNAFAALASSVEDLSKSLQALGEDRCLQVEETVEKSVLEVEESVWERVRRVAEAVGRQGEADLNRVSSQLLHDRLQQLDPDMAQALHPNNKRKIFRSLQVLAQKGKTHSALLQEQRGQMGGCQLGGPLRYPNTAILWLQAQTEVLNARLDARVDDMIRRGLLEELLEFHREYNESRLESDKRLGTAYTQGIFQSIGFKEFHKYLILSEEAKETEEGRQLLEEGIEALKLVTRRYAKKQNKWVRNRFLKAATRQVPPVYSLDTTDVSRWDEAVSEPASAIVSSMMGKDAPQDDQRLPQPLPRDSVPLPPSTGSHYCEACQRIFIGTLQWEAHLKSKKHASVVKKNARQPESKPSVTEP